MAERIASESAVQFGERVLGPIFAEFALRLHAYLLGLEDPEGTRLMFCARGGLRLRYLYETVLRRLEQRSPAPFSDFMVSRLIAARSALAANADEAFQELDREFKGTPFGVAISALAQTQIDLPAEQAASMFSSARLRAMLSEDGHAGGELRGHVGGQNQLFDDYLKAEIGSARRVLLCDTGLYGSTLRLFQAGRPDLDWACVLFARSNYKGFSTPHFSVTTGLCVEADGYRVFDPRTSVLRYWHLVEDTLEPALSSVTRFERRRGSVVSNLVIPGWSDAVAPRPGERFAGVIAYIEALPRDGFAQKVLSDAGSAWKELKRAIVWPNPLMRPALDLAPRSRDFGRNDKVLAMADRGGHLERIRSSLWREGAIMARYPTTYRVWHLALEAAYGAQALRNGARSALQKRIPD